MISGQIRPQSEATLLVSLFLSPSIEHKRNVKQLDQNEVEIVPGKWTRFIEGNNNNNAPSGEMENKSIEVQETQHSPGRSSERSSENESDDSGKPAARDAGSPVPILTTHTASSGGGGSGGVYRSREQYHVYPQQFAAREPMSDPTFVTDRTTKKFVDYDAQDAIDG